MKEIILRIPENKVEFIMELFAHLGIEVSSDEYIIPDEHKNIVRERIESTTSDNLISWSDARERFIFKKKG